MNTVLQIVREYAVYILFLVCLAIKRFSTKFGQMHAAVTIMAADSHVPQFPEKGARIIFGK